MYMKKVGKRFDKNNIDLISSFLNLKDSCYTFEKHFLGKDFHQTNLNKLSFISYSSFYSSFKDVCDLPLFFLLNEEVSNEHERDFVPEILLEAINSEKFKSMYDKESGSKSHGGNIHIEEIRHLLSQNYNQIVGSMMLDFSVSSFSVFEYWIDYFYNKLCQNHKHEILQKRRNEKRIIIEKNKDNIDVCLDKISKIPGDFISFPDKLSGVLSFVKKENYKRDLKHDRKIIDFLSKKRNAVHNLGIHRGADYELQHKGVDFVLKQDEPIKCDSWVDCLAITGELIKIYTAIIASIDLEERQVESFVEPRIDNLAIEILSKSINECFIFCDDNEESVSIFKGMLVNKFGFDEESSIKFIDNIKNNKENLDFSNISGIIALSAMRL